jgi:hypothetical protein
MAGPIRISPHDAWERTQYGAALLVCAYDDEAKCNKILLEGSIPFSKLKSVHSTLPKDQEIIFYCA